MTRKQALIKVLEILSKMEDTAQTEEIKEKINDIMKDLPLTKWTNKTIFDTINQWVEDNKKLPSSYDISRNRLPPVSVIKNKFGLTYKEFICKYYKDKIINYNSRYLEESADYWVEIFKSEFKRISPKSAKEYNKKRNKNYPTWETTAKMLNIGKWLELLKYCGLSTYQEKKIYTRKKVCNKINVTRTFDVEELMSK